MIYLDHHVSSIVFDQVDIYSFNRGKLLTNYLVSLEVEKEHLKALMENEPDFDKELELNKRVKQIEKYNPFLDHILSSDGAIHKTARLIGSFSVGNQGFDRLKNILHTKTTSPIASRCLEEYRDAIVFKNKGTITEAMSICFHCAGIRFSETPVLYASEAFYNSYRSFLSTLQHDIELR